MQWLSRLGLVVRNKISEDEISVSRPAAERGGSWPHHGGKKKTAMSFHIIISHLLRFVIRTLCFGPVLLFGTTDTQENVQHIFQIFSEQRHGTKRQYSDVKVKRFSRADKQTSCKIISQKSFSNNRSHIVKRVFTTLVTLYRSIGVCVCVCVWPCSRTSVTSVAVSCDRLNQAQLRLMVSKPTSEREGNTFNLWKSTVFTHTHTHKIGYISFPSISLTKASMAVLDSKEFDESDLHSGNKELSLTWSHTGGGGLKMCNNRSRIR